MKLVLLSILVFIFIACGKGKETPLKFSKKEARKVRGVKVDEIEDDETQDFERISFEDLQRRVFTSYRCSSCHERLGDSFLKNEDEFSSFINFDKPKESEVFKMMVKGEMPPVEDGFTQVAPEDLKVFLNYVKTKKEQMNQFRVVEFEDIQEKIFKKHGCTQCHLKNKSWIRSEEALVKKLSLDNPKGSGLYKSMETQWMPWGPHEKVPSKKLKLLLDFIKTKKERL